MIQMQTMLPSGSQLSVGDESKQKCKVDGMFVVDVVVLQLD